ncbi:MAG: anthranilate phosphoribosyltransferase [Dehalococcoidales bacterium]|nr:anthranilate phosphoribosyltransferase [Dehalococcoidales bacterium]
MIREAIGTVADGCSLTFEQASAVMNEIMNGDATPSQIAALVVALRVKGETVDEIAGLASVMREKAIPVRTNLSVVDTCGMGGDESGSINISTAAALIAAGAGMKVAKHGNRAMSSRCGSADVLEALGVKIDLGAEAVAECLERIGLCFMLATVFHPSMRFAAATRREIGIRTVFNILGPLTNPARAEFQVVGVPTMELSEKTARVLHSLGSKHALVVHGKDGMDEISISSPTVVWEVTPEGVLSRYEVSPRDFGFEEARSEEIKGGTAKDNAGIILRILSGERGAGRNIAVMNAAAAMVVGRKSSDLVAGVRLAEKVIDSGMALEKLNALVQLSQSLDRDGGNGKSRT